MDSSHGMAFPIKVFVASDVRLHREGLAALLCGCPSIQVMGADNVLGTQDALRVTEVDVALIDALSPSDSDTIRALRQICASVRIFAFGIRETATEILACAAAGIDGYIGMDAALQDTVTAIENVVRGELDCSSKVAASLYQSVQSVGHSAAAVGFPLTTREIQVAD